MYSILKSILTNLIAVLQSHSSNSLTKKKSLLATQLLQLVEKNDSNLEYAQKVDEDQSYDTSSSCIL